MDKQLKSELALIIITIIWGLGFPITSLALNYGYSPLFIVFSRMIIGFLVLGSVFRKRLSIKIDYTLIIYFIVGTLLFLGFALQTIGLKYTTASKNGFLTQLNVIFIPFLMYILFKQQIKIKSVITACISILGIFILTEVYNDSTGLNIGDTITILCAFVVAFHVIYSSKFMEKYDIDPVHLTVYSFLFAALWSFVFIIDELFTYNYSLKYSWTLLFMGLLNTSIGFLVQSFALKYSTPSRVSIIITLEAVVGTIGSIFILGEFITINIIFGGILISSAVLLQELID